MKNTRKIVPVSIIAFLLFNMILSPVSALGAKIVVSSKAVYPDKKIDNILESIKKGEKLSQKETFFAQGDGVVSGRYTVFVRKNSKKKVIQNLKKISSVNIGGQYDEVIAVPIDISDEKNIDKILSDLEKDPDIVAVTQVAKRTPSAVTVPNDPLYPPSGNFTNTYQWYLNQPASGNYGIDVLRAWQYLDAQGKAWQGDSSVKVAVIDTGLAFETYENKYDTGSVSWDFTAFPDIPANINTNSGETANNGIDDDANGAIEDTLESPFDTLYCLDANANGQCDSPTERTKGYIDDVNGLNVIDFYKFWAPYQVSSASNCSNAPYTSYKCVPEKLCDTVGTSGSDSWGCVAKDIGHPNDLAGHGTAVTSIIAGAVNNSTAGAGIAPGVTILPIAIFGYEYSAGEWVYNPDSGSADYVARAVEYAVAQGAKIINMSFGGTIPDAYEELAIARAYEDDGVLVIAASGNRYSSSVDYPAQYSTVIGVGSVNKDGTRPTYSNYGTGLELSAPVGAGVPLQSYSCYFTGDPSGSYDNPCLKTSATPSSPSQFTQFSTGLTAGTSFAAPQVSAVAALIWTLHPTWSNEQVRYVLKMSATTNIGYTATYGYGILNAYNAVKAVDYANHDLTQTDRVFQSVRGNDNLLYTRYSDDHGNTWGGWNSSMGTIDEVSMVYSTNASKLIQAVRGSDNGLYIRNSSDFGNTWGSWSKIGSTLGKVALVDTGTNVVLTMRGTNNQIYTRITTNGGTSWSQWSTSGGTKGVIDSVYDSAHSRIVQSVRGTNNSVYTRYSSDKGSTWSNWVASGSTYGNPKLVVAGNKVLLAVRGINNDLYMRYSINGGGSWSAWYKNSTTRGDVAMTYTGTHVIQSIRGSSDIVMTRYSTNKGLSWSAWNKSGQTKNSIELQYDGQMIRVYQAIIGVDGVINTRYSIDNGSTWTAWVRNGGSPLGVEMSLVVTANW